MDYKDREKIEKIVKDRKIAHELLLSKGSKVYKSFLNLERKAFSDGNLKKMYKARRLHNSMHSKNCKRKSCHWK